MSAEPAIYSLHINDTKYPRLLSEIQNPPSPLFVKGVPPEENCVAIVGTRKASLEGRRLAKNTATEIARRGICVVSGLAFGIDEAAHRGALEAEGKTIAVLANGLDCVYPKQHEQLAKDIISKNGTLLSEYQKGTPSLPHQFLERNRIISGLSLAVIVIEAPLRSGSIATARHAAEQGRDVFVFPGNTRDKNYEGSHMLIRNGARLVSSIEHILEDIGISSPESDKTKRNTDLKKYRNDSHAMNILMTLSNQSTHINIDKLSELTTLEPRILTESLMLLVIDGIVEEKNGTFIIRL